MSGFNTTVLREHGVFNQAMIGFEGIATRQREVLDDARTQPDYRQVMRALAPAQAPRRTRAAG